MTSSAQHKAPSIHPREDTYLGLSNTFHLHCLERYREGLVLPSDPTVREDVLKQQRMRVKELSPFEQDMLYLHSPTQTLDQAIYRHGESLWHLFHGKHIFHPHVMHILTSLSDQHDYPAHPAPGFSQLYRFLVDHNSKNGRPIFDLHTSHAPHPALGPPHAGPVTIKLESSYGRLPFHYHAELLQAMTHCAGHTNLTWLNHYNSSLFAQIWHAAFYEQYQSAASTSQAVAATPAHVQLARVADYLQKLQERYRSIHRTC